MPTNHTNRHESHPGFVLLLFVTFVLFVGTLSADLVIPGVLVTEPPPSEGIPIPFGTGLADAPSTGGPYGRQSNAWVEVTGGGTGAVSSVNGKTGSVTIDSSDVGAAPTGHVHTVADVNSGTWTGTVAGMAAEAVTNGAAQGAAWGASSNLYARSVTVNGVAYGVTNGCVNLGAIAGGAFTGWTNWGVFLMTTTLTFNGTASYLSTWTNIAGDASTLVGGTNWVWPSAGGFYNFEIRPVWTCGGTDSCRSYLKTNGATVELAGGLNPYNTTPLRMRSPYVTTSEVFDVFFYSSRNLNKLLGLDSVPEAYYKRNCTIMTVWRDGVP